MITELYMDEILPIRVNITYKGIIVVTGRKKKFSFTITFNTLRVN